MPPTPPGILAVPHSIGPKVTRIKVIIAIKIDDEIMYVHPTSPGSLEAVVERGMEGTTAAPHLAGAEIEYIVPNIDPEYAAQSARYGRFQPRRNGKYPRSWEDPARQEWPR
jgi:hypothetical protein